MKYSTLIQDNLEEIKEIVSNWPVNINFEDVLAWTLQFDVEDFELALRIIRNLNVLGFDDVNEAIKIAFSKVNRVAIKEDSRITQRNTVYAGLGNAAKSGSMISYHFRVLNGISENNFIHESHIEKIKNKEIQNIVLVDDVIASGDTAVKEINKLRESLIIINPEIKVFLLTVCGMKKGLDRINEEVGVSAFAAYEYTEVDTITSLDSPFYEGIKFDQRSSLKEKIIEYGKVTNKSGLGYKGIGALMVFPYNTPNCTLPVIWGDVNGWIPLFKRAGRVTGISSVFNDLDRTANEKVEKVKRDKGNSQIKKGKSLELDLYVEGKRDEKMFKFISERYDLPKELGYEKVNVIPIGGLVFSQKVIDALEFAENDTVLISEEDVKHLEIKFKEKGRDVPIIFLNPSIMQFVDLKGFFNSKEITQFLSILPGFLADFNKEYTDNGELSKKSLNILERYLFDNRLLYDVLIKSSLDEMAIETFIKQLKEELEKR
ncbi:uracil phosphoribosyltransferase [Bacillus thuringiensis]|uniref:uracil phosphoribosyltransferase n=1 Tax=Bacillus thuringiensis TaxID=1428 RepID=UPI001CD26D6D|nr:uracil phosphoribosyltransferase [Bacillus thuringiensis]MCA1001013.1 uracil phosphoribosyltransferase [Bacillus thuringiensis]